MCAGASSPTPDCILAYQYSSIICNWVWKQEKQRSVLPSPGIRVIASVMHLTVQPEGTHSARCRSSSSPHQLLHRPHTSSKVLSGAHPAAHLVPYGGPGARILLPPAHVLQVSSPDTPQNRDQLLGIRGAAHTPNHHLLSPSQHRNGKSWNNTTPGESLLAHTTNTRRIKLCSDWSQLKRVVQTHGHYFNHINIAAALVQLAGFPTRPQQPPPHSHSASDSDAWNAYAAYEELLQHLLQMCAACVTHMGARQVANCMWAAARLSTGYTDGHPMATAVLQQLMDAQASYLLPWSNAQELGNSIWAVAVSGVSPSDDWLCQFLGATETLLDTPHASCQDLVTIIWALSVLGIAPDQQWLAAFMRRAQEVQQQMTHRDAAQTMAATARLQINMAADAPELALNLQKRILECNEDLDCSKPRAYHSLSTSEHMDGRWCVSVSQGLWALATVSSVPATAWMQQALHMIESRLHDFTPHELSVSMWAAATLGQALPPSLIRGLYTTTLVGGPREGAGSVLPGQVEAAAQLVAGFNPQSLAQLIWAISLADRSCGTRSSTVSRPLAPPAHWTRAFLECVSSQLSDFNDQAISMTLVALARLGITPSPEWVSKVLTHVTSHIEHASPQALSNCMWAIAKMGYSINQDGADALEMRLFASLMSTSSQATSGAAAQAQGTNSQAASDSSALLDNSAPGQVWSSQELSNALYAFGCWRHRPSDELMQVMLAHLRSLYQHAVGSTLTRAPSAATPHGINTQELSNTIWSLSVLGVQPSDAWLSAFLSAATHNLRRFNAKDISQLVYALAKLDRRPPVAAAGSADNLLDQPAPAVPKRSKYKYKTTGQASSAAAAAASLASTPRQSHTAFVSSMPRGLVLEDGIPDTVPAPSASEPARPQAPAALPSTGLAPATAQWFGSLLAEAAAIFNKFNGQDLANLCWGLVQLQVQPGQHWCARLAEELQTRSSAFTGPHVALCIWALGKFGYRPAPGSLIRLEGCLFRRMPSLAPRELAACISGFSAMGYVPHVEWLEEFADRCMQLSPQFSQQDWSVVVWGLASVVDADPSKDMFLEDLFLSPQLISQIHEFAPRNVAILTYSCSILGAKSPKLVKQLLATATEHMPSFSATDMSAVIMACARMHAVPDAAFFNAWTQQMRLRLEHTERQLTVAPAPASLNGQGFGSKAAAPAPMPSLLQGDPAALSSVMHNAADDHTAAPQQDQVQLASLEPLPGSVLAVSAYCLATLKLRPAASWLALFCRVLHHHVRHMQLGSRELIMTVFALHMWRLPVDPALQAALKALSAHHRPVYTAREWQTLRVSLKGIAQVAKEAAPAPQKRGRSKAA